PVSFSNDFIYLLPFFLGGEPFPALQQRLWVRPRRKGFCKVIPCRTVAPERNVVAQPVQYRMPEPEQQRDKRHGRYPHYYCARYATPIHSRFLCPVRRDLRLSIRRLRSKRQVTLTRRVAARYPASAGRWLPRGPSIAPSSV